MVVLFFSFLLLITRSAFLSFDLSNSCNSWVLMPHPISLQSPHTLAIQSRKGHWFIEQQQQQKGTVLKRTQKTVLYARGEN